MVSEYNEWIMKGIKTSCKYRWDLYLNSHCSNSRTMKIHHKTYGKVLTQVIKEAKHVHKNKQVLRRIKR
jgi:hypothetical protein